LNVTYVLRSLQLNVGLNPKSLSAPSGEDRQHIQQGQTSAQGFTSVLQGEGGGGNRNRHHYSNAPRAPAPVLQKKSQNGFGEGSGLTRLEPKKDSSTAAPWKQPNSLAHQPVLVMISDLTSVQCQYSRPSISGRD
jgi:hypothetical protein